MAPLLAILHSGDHSQATHGRPSASCVRQQMEHGVVWRRRAHLCAARAAEFPPFRPGLAECFPRCRVRAVAQILKYRVALVRVLSIHQSYRKVSSKNDGAHVRHSQWPHKQASMSQST
eukprot:5054163-Prymnesium_polylepis.1